VLLGIGFLLRLGFMLWNKLYVFHPQPIFEVSSSAAHIAGARVSSPFAEDTALLPGSTAYPYFVAAGFKIFGIYSAHRWPSYWRCSADGGELRA